ARRTTRDDFDRPEEAKREQDRRLRAKLTHVCPCGPRGFRILCCGRRSFRKDKADYKPRRTRRKPSASLTLLGIQQEETEQTEKRAFENLCYFCDLLLEMSGRFEVEDVAKQIPKRSLGTRTMKATRVRNRL